MGKRDVTVTVEGPMSSEADAVDDLRTQLAAANIDAANLEAEKNDLVAQLAAAGQERDEARDAARVIGGLRVAGEQKYRALLVENRVLRDRFFAVRELVAPYRYTDYAAIAAWPLLEVIPDAPLTTAEAERVKRMEGELRNCIGALTRRQ